MSPLRGAFILLVLLAVGAATILAAPTPTVVIADTETETVLYSTSVTEGSTLVLNYTHSVERSPVSERYRITDGQLQQTKIVFESYGWGLPTDATVERVEGQFHAPMDRRYDELMITPGPIADQHLSIEETQISLYELAGRSSIRVSVEYH
jgi:Uncharacterized conserved protein